MSYSNGCGGSVGDRTKKSTTSNVTSKTTRVRPGDLVPVYPIFIVYTYSFVFGTIVLQIPFVLSRDKQKA